MSTPDATASESEFDGVADPSDFKQKRRIKAILNARERFVEQYRKALDLQAKGHVDERLAERMLRQAAKEYALESEHVIRANLPDTTSDPRKWTAEEEAAYHTWTERDLGVLEMRTDTKEFQGVEEFIEAPRRITETWREPDDDPVGGTNDTVHRHQYEIPLDVSEQTYRALNYFWHEFGLDVEMDEKLPHDEI